MYMNSFFSKYGVFTATTDEAVFTFSYFVIAV